MTWRAPVERNEHTWGVDVDGIPYTVKSYDAVRSYTFDFSTAKEIAVDGATISTATWSEAGVTISSESNTTTTVTCVVTGTGTAKLTLVMSDAQEIEQRFRWRDVNGSFVGDYDNA